MDATAPIGLSARERQCLLGAARGLVSNQIGIELGLSSRTVDAHIANAKRKLGVRTRVAAVAILVALEAGSR